MFEKEQGLFKTKNLQFKEELLHVQQEIKSAEGWTEFMDAVLKCATEVCGCKRV